MSLFDIWTGVDFNDRESSYQKAIDLLKKDNILASGPFVDESNGKLYWRSSIVGTFQYLAAFIQGCIRAKRIIDSHSSADYQVILGNTFNVTFDPKPFKSIGTRSIDFHYLDPFKPLDRLLTNPRIT